MIKAVTFDCAQTLIGVDWKPAALAVRCAELAGFSFDKLGAAGTYDRLLRASWAEFQDLNLTRDCTQTDAFWMRLTETWADQCGFPAGSAQSIVDIAEQELYGPRSSVFSLYDDVVPCLDQLQSAGLQMAVVSNWDISLHRTLRSFGLSDYFETVVASMEIGIEKPDERIFRAALEKLGVLPTEALHVGDNPLDDYRGARGAGMDAVVIDRQTNSTSRVFLKSLSDLAERLEI